MNNVLCIFPKDCTTEFLNPVYEDIISIYTAKGLLGDPTEDDEYLEKLSSEASRADSIIFLGHGSSKSLYGLNFNEIICKENENIDIFNLSIYNQLILNILRLISQKYGHNL